VIADVGLLLVEALRASYGRKEVLHGISFQLGPGQVVALLGPNGAGKTTALKTIFGLLPPSAGRVRFLGRDVTGWAPAKVMAAGLGIVPQKGGIFADLTVDENLAMGGYTVLRAELREGLEAVFQLFPVLAERRTQLAGTMSGGERQMLAIAMSLIARPRLLLLDEPSTGLAPALVERVMESIVDINQRLGTAILLVEQNVNQALAVAEKAYVLRLGEIIAEEPAAALQSSERLWAFF
jgi:branched-chain amino acid transport system ATP-binding protein